MDAVAFSLLDMSMKASLPVQELVLAMLLASLANTLTKGGLVCVLGAKSMRKPILPAVVLICLCTAGLIGFYL